MKLNDVDKINIIVMRGLGYHQDEIANNIMKSTKTVGNYLTEINEQAKKCKNSEEMYYFFWKSLIGDGMISLLRILLRTLFIYK